MSGQMTCIVRCVKYVGVIRQRLSVPVCLHVFQPSRAVLGSPACLQTGLHHLHTYNMLAPAAVASKQTSFTNSVPLVGCRGMAGHSKWQNIKNIKSAKDSEKSKLSLHYSRKIKSIIRESGNADPKFNSRLASVISEAKSKNIPNSTLEAAINQAVMSKNTSTSVVYEGRGPAGSWFIIETVTDKPIKTKNELQGIFKKFGGLLGEANSARHAFEHKGIIEVNITEEKVDMDKYVEVAIETGAEDVMLQIDEDNNKYLEFFCEPSELNQVKKKLEEKGLDVQSASEEYFPALPVTPAEEDRDIIARFIGRLENEFPEVVRIHVNIDSSVLS
ncbi:probable transcriptional regulatory protein Cagg_2594 [Gigantopelta aegis]|uniref:probable transcriptional regulatory protein Cagg_2594 n=1 Tax=Gigantopelta aegis TaxID=1735272 RepID=UPI001B889B3E|nr:probable transcriptional regulatory protein Cagg_2594 [Gigantopelta aegis]